MSTLAPPDPATRKIVRDRPYDIFVDRAFGPKSTRAERKLLRFVYRQFRAQTNSTPFSARALTSCVLMDLDRIKDGR